MTYHIRVLVLLAVLIFAFGEDYNPQYHVETVPERSILGEGPYWDADKGLLFYVDMRNMWVNSYNPETGELFKATILGEMKPVTLVIPLKDSKDQFVLGLKGSLGFIQWDGKSNKEILPNEFMDVEDPSSGSRCNDGKVDASNRLWVGTMGKQTKSDPKGNEFEKDKGKMFRIDVNGRKTEMVSNMQIPNGLEWSLDKKKFYLVDSLTPLVTEYDYDDGDGSISNGKVLYNLKADGLIEKPNSLPDGMTIDAEGYLWIAVYGTGKVIRVNPKNGKKVFEIQLDQVLQPTSVCFGGKNLDILFVTSARVDWTKEFEEQYPKSGHLFKITNLGVKGASASRPFGIQQNIKP